MHEVPVEANAFLYIAEEPEVGQRVREVWARTASGLVAVPFAPIPSAVGQAAGPRTPPPAPAVEREVTGGEIGWLERREERGEPLDVLPEGSLPMVRRQVARGDVVFGRVLTPDPDHPLRIVVTLNAHKAGGPVAGLCTWTLTRPRGGGGGCAPYPGVFDLRGGTPFTYGMSGGGPSAFTNVNGFASDDVERLEAVLADRQVVDVPLTDNFYAIDLPRANLPALLVAYDSDDRVIGVSDPLTDFLEDIARTGAPARGKAELLWRVAGPDGSYAELAVGPSTSGGECQFLRQQIDDRQGGRGQFCAGERWTGAPVQLTAGWSPGRFVNGRVRDDVKTVRIRFADGETVLVKPRRGYVLYAVPGNRLNDDRRATSAEGLDADGHVVGRSEFPRMPAGDPPVLPGPGG
jgi:hypothetical protein